MTANTTIIDAPIAAVTVYTDRARVTRRTSCTLAVGEHTLALTNLPTTIEEDSVRVSGKGSDIKIIGVEVIKQFIVKPPEDLIAEMTKQLQSLQDRDKELTDNDGVEVSRLEFLGRLRDHGSSSFANGLAFGRASMENVAMLAEYISTEMALAHQRRREIAQERRNLDRELEATRARLAQVQRGESKERRDIHVAIEVTAETEFDIDISYAAKGASWQPLYDIRLVEDQVNVTYLANIRQQTGEDWPMAELSLSTARPAATTTIPELDPWYVDINQPPPPPMHYAAAQMPARASGGTASFEQAASLTQSAAMMPQSAPKPVAQVAKATVESSGAAITYRVKRSIAVPTDGTPHKTTVTTLDFEARLDYVTIPKLAEEAYLRAKITNSSEFALLPGPANIFHGSDFVGTTRLDMIAPNEEFEVQLGIDERLKVERKLIERTTAKTFLGGSKRTTYAYRIILTNNLSTAAQVTVFDQLPLSRHEDIKVKQPEITPKPNDQNGLNVVTWEMEIKPREKRELSISFMVEHPRDMMIRGVS